MRVFSRLYYSMEWWRGPASPGLWLHGIAHGQRSQGPNDPQGPQHGAVWPGGRGMQRPSDPPRALGGGLRPIRGLFERQPCKSPLSLRGSLRSPGLPRSYRPPESQAHVSSQSVSQRHECPCVFPQTRRDYIVVRSHLPGHQTSHAVSSTISKVSLHFGSSST